MTVTYSSEVCTAHLCGFAKLLVRWRGSIYRLLYREMMIYIVLYYAIAMLYRYALIPEQQRDFEELCIYCRKFIDLIPLTFVLSFYVTMVVNRWWDQFKQLPWPDRCCLKICAYIPDRPGERDTLRMIRRALARYLNLMAILTLRATSIAVKKRFPTIDHIVDAGLLSEEEAELLDSAPTPHGTWWVPSTWFINLVRSSREKGYLMEESSVRELTHEMIKYRGMCGMLWCYDWLSVPLVYTQVVTMSVYTFFIATLFGQQYMLGDKDRNAVERYLPLFTFSQFFFYMGWLKVAEELLNPMGEDDDDFELNWLIDRNVQVSNCIVDDLMSATYPALYKDPFWNDPEPQIPYTAATADSKIEPFLGSAADVDINQADMDWLDVIPEEPPRRFDRGISSVSYVPFVDVDDTEALISEQRQPAPLYHRLMNRVRRFSLRSAITPATSHETMFDSVSHRNDKPFAKSQLSVDRGINGKKSKRVLNSGQLVQRFLRHTSTEAGSHRHIVSRRKVKPRQTAGSRLTATQLSSALNSDIGIDFDELYPIRTMTRSRSDPGYHQLSTTEDGLFEHSFNSAIDNVVPIISLNPSQYFIPPTITRSTRSYSGRRY